MNNADIVILNATNKDLRIFHDAFVAVARGAELPEAIADLFVAVVFDREDGKRVVRIDWA